MVGETFIYKVLSFLAPCGSILATGYRLKSKRHPLSREEEGNLSKAKKLKYQLIGMKRPLNELQHLLNETKNAV